MTNAHFHRTFLRLFRVTFPTIAALFCILPWAYSQPNSPDNAPDLDVLLSKKQYPQLEQALAARSTGLSPKAHAYLAGVMANRINRVKTSLGLLEPLVPGLLVSDPRRG